MQQETGFRNELAQAVNLVLEKIERLNAGVEDEVKPTKYASSRARSIVESAYAQINANGHLPDASATTDDVGGIRLAWRNGPKHVLANFGAEAHLRSYIYFESPQEHQIEALDAHHLAGRLVWLANS
jgi:hypothetical protein